ncbi:peptidase C14, caspase domain-containing protein [Mycena rebaudengoi]|nr:peptidase C14, caspase domain-containing protein [Mycena rebaudengoi]
MQSPSDQYADEIPQRLASSPSQLRSLDSPPPCKKKALLIGISSPSSSSPNSEDRVLRGPHKDVAQMKTLLVETYGYREQDIAVLVDDGILGNPQPERHQILASIRDLVKDAQKGDTFFFHYCGHAIQVPNRSNTEEDGLDECVIPLDGEDRRISDNELHASLVDTLPAGATLIAVFDCCHSASLLDLQHSRCNRVYVPWLSKGMRRSDDKRNRIVRRLALPAESPSWSTSARTLHQSARYSPTLMVPRRTPNNVYSPHHSPQQSPKNSPLSPSFLQMNLSAAIPNTTPTAAGAPKRKFSQSRPQLRASHIPPLKLVCDIKENWKLAVSPEASPPSARPWVWDGVRTPVTSTLLSSVTLCESPLNLFCNGWCRNPGYDTNQAVDDAQRDVAEVICLAACKDSELSWENADGVSMTSALVDVLSKTPHPTLQELVTTISHTIHGMTRERHRKANAWRKYRRGRPSASSDCSFDTETFQHPQIVSQRPLDLNMCWDL